MRHLPRVRAPDHRNGSGPMWVLMYVFSYSISPAASNDRAEWRLMPTVVFQEFSDESRCQIAKSKLEESLNDAGRKLKSGLEDLRSVGKGGWEKLSSYSMSSAFRNKIFSHFIISLLQEGSHSVNFEGFDFCPAMISVHLLVTFGIRAECRWRGLILRRIHRYDRRSARAMAAIRPGGA